MKANDGKDVKVTSQVTRECLKKLKILAIQKEINLQEIIKEVLEKAMSKKANVTEFAED